MRFSMEAKMPGMVRISMSFSPHIEKLNSMVSEFAEMLLAQLYIWAKHNKYSTVNGYITAEADVSYGKNTCKIGFNFSEKEIDNYDAEKYFEKYIEIKKKIAVIVLCEFAYIYETGMV